MALKTHHERRRLPYRPEQIFDLVADVERYPEFLPWVRSLRIMQNQVDHDGFGALRAEMIVNFKLYEGRFVTDVDLDRPKGTIDVHYLHGPFKELRNAWRFEEHPRGCVVDFKIAFEFRNRLFQSAAQRFLDLAVGRLAEAFERRAHQVYGSVNSKIAAE
jgi:coenzyme Q-binding protein COQ10